MFKIESFITPLILKNVEKFVKNVHPRDSQVSLWGGEAVFNNLDLRLDVLEHELQLPFTFINGHIHELRINVPWTKLGSEPIIITINTFECIVKLKDGSETESVDSQSDDGVKTKRKLQRLEVEDAPPSYVQSLINRITNNITVICNNVILKYVEGDIVLSINVKSAQLHSANEKWEKAYIDLTPADLATRKLINLIDITICLDQRNASGKIETYQEPLLYRSSMEGRLYLAYDSVNAKTPTVTRCDFKCDQLEISISDQQLPMFLRLVQLCLALYFGDLVIAPKNPSGDTPSIDLPSTEGDDEQSWGSWAWSLVPEMNAIWEDEEPTDEDGGSGPQPPHPVFHFGAHLHRASVTCKLTEINSNQKVTFRPFAQLNIEGLFVDAVVRQPDCVNIQLGASAVQAVSLSDCVCSGPFFAKEQYEEPILALSGQLGCNEMSYLEQTLFNELSPENQHQRRDYNYEWEEHFADLTENKLLKRSPAVAMDYFYLLTLPEDQPDDLSAGSFNDLEDSNLKEKLKVRVVVGPCEANFTGGFAHRIQKFVACAFNREFEPYSNIDEGAHSGSKHSMPNAEDIALMEEFIPFKNYVLTIIQPTLRLFASDHPYCEVNALPVQQHKKNKSVNASFEPNVNLSTRPVIVAQVNRIEIQQIVPMYAKRVVKVASTMCPISDHFLYNSQSHVTAKLFSAEVNLATMNNNKCENNINIIPPLSVAYYLKELQHPTMWNNPFQPKMEQFVEMARFTTHLTWPQILIISGILNSWYKPCVEKVKFLQTSLLQDALTPDNVFPSIEFSVTGVQCKYSMNDAIHSAIAWLSTCRLGLQYWRNDTFSNVTIFHGPEERENIYSVDFFKEPSQTPAVDFLLASSDQCVKVVIQFPINMDSCSAPTIFLMSVKGLSFCLDPSLFDWLDYFPAVPVEGVTTTINRETPVRDDLVEVQSKGSAPDSAQLTGITESLTQVNQKQTSPEMFSVSKEFITEFCLGLFPIMKRLLIEVQLETCTIFLPTNSVSISPNSTNIIRGMHKMFSTRMIPDSLVINLPRVLVHSGTQKQNLHASIDDIPIYTLEGLNLSQDLFPWTLNLCNFSIYTLNSKKEAIYCLNPLSSSATIALTSESTIEDKISKINLCVHADTKSVHVKLTDKQVKIVSSIAQIILDALSKFVSRAISAKNLFAITLGGASSELSVNLDKSAASTSQGEVMSSSLLENNILTVEQEKSQLELPKYSIWMQWTLPKLTVDLSSSQAYLLSLDLEELVLSVDVQDVYSKVKLKLTSFNWNHYQKDESLVQWIPGPFKGIFFSCSDKLNKSVNILNPKTESAEVSSGFNLFESSSKTSKTSYNFLTVTFTRALSKNVQRRWTQLLREHNDQMDSNLINSQPENERYVSEIDIKVRSFDCVLWCPVLVKGYEILEPLFKLKFPFLSYTTPKLFVETEEESPKPHFQMFNNNNLPLLYLNASAIRVFVPKGFEKDVQNVEDMCIFQTEKIIIASQVENPLSRIILRPDVYSLAQQARIVHVPGSEVEDRQYQVDITGVSVSTGSWEELVKRSSVNKKPSISSQLKTMGENPALEWNNKSVDTLIDSDFENDLIFMPLVDQFNARILVAPAIVYQQIIPMTKQRDDILVSGNSFEVNLTSDIDVYVNLKQLSLLFNICQENILSFGHLIRIPSEKVNIETVEEKEVQKPLSSSWTLNEPPDSGIEIRLDSGTESEISTLQKESTLTSTTPVVAFVPPADVIIEQQQMLSQTFEQKWNIENVVPFETLFTARRFTFSAYADKLTRSESRIKEEKKTSTFISKKRRPKRKSCHTVGKLSDLEWKSLEEQEKLNELNLKSGEVDVSSLHDGYEGSEEDSVEECTESGDKNSNGSVISPMLYLMISQPHAFLRCRHSTSKLEISCFDVSIKGSNDKISIPVTETKFVPNMNDYPVSWFETKPGDADTKTGIPPALITISVTNFLMGSTDIKTSLDRPLKLNLSLLKYEQILDYIREAMSVTIGSTKSTKSEVENPFKQKSSTNIQDHIETIRHFATFIRFIHFATVQIVIVLETVPNKENAFVVIAWDDVNGTVKFKEGKDALVDEVSLGLSIENFAIKTSYNNHLRTLLQPTTAVISSNAIWDFWNRSSFYPRTCTSVETEAAMVYFGKETWLCFLKMMKHVDEFLKSFKSESNPTKSSSSTKMTETSKSQLELQEQTWHDDLRVGRFQYIQDSDDTGLQPEPNEIVFCREQVGQSASMTWCYEEPRALTRVEIYPVPFRTASDTGIQENVDSKDEVGCVLQYWDPLTRSYITCRHFNLSETQHCNLNLPRIAYGDTKQKLFISRRWRVILDYYDTNDEDSEEPIIRRSLVSPLALAACMRVDSYFNPNLIPMIQARLAMELIHVNFTNHLHHDAKGMSMNLNPFSWDGVTPHDQDCLTVVFQNSSVCGYSWQNWSKLECNTVSSIDVLEYGSLTMRPFAEPCQVNAQWMYSEEQNMPPITDCALRIGPLFVHVGQSLIHTINTLMSNFLKKQDSVPRKDLTQPLLSYYVICNDTQESIRFGQVNLDENIVLQSRQMHAYSWRSHRTKQLLHVCVEGMQWKWCEPFSIDKIGTEIRTMEQKGQRVNLIIKIKKLNPLQKQIIISGQLVFANRLNQHLEVKLTPVFHATEDNRIGGEQSFVVSQQNSAATCISEPGTRKAFRVRCAGSVWSEEVYFPQKSLVIDSTLIKIPLRDDQYFKFWCHFFIQSVGPSICRMLVLFTPVYIVQTHLAYPVNLILTTPGLGQTHCVQVDGYGQEFQLHCPGDSDVTHQLSFQSSPGLATSQPALPLSVNMISQVTKLPYPSKINIDEMTSSWMSNHSLLWPYDDKDFEKKVKNLPPGIAECILKSQKPQVKRVNYAQEQPNIDLEVCLAQRWPACNTLLIDVKPWGLIVNRSSIDLLLKNNEDLEWKIVDGEAFACPKLKEYLILGVEFDGCVHYSDKLQLTDEDWSFRRYLPKIEGSLPEKGFLKCDIKIKGDNHAMLCSLTITTNNYHGMRIIQIQPTFNVVNSVGISFKCATSTSPATDEKIEYQPHILHTTELKPKGELDRNVMQSLLFWESFQPEVIYYASDEDHVKYVSVRYSSVQNNLENWSLPCRIQSHSNITRQTIVVPLPDEDISNHCGLPLVTRCFVITAHELDAVTYLVISEDKNPQMIIHNLCTVGLHFGQSNQRSPDSTVEEMEIIDYLPLVTSMTACHYTLPQISKNFPLIHDPETLAKLQFAKICEQNGDDEEVEFYWSNGVDTSSDGDLFLNIPNYSDVKIHIETVAHVVYLFVEPVSRVEVSAKEIRGRIQTEEQVSEHKIFIRQEFTKSKKRLHSGTSNPKENKISQKQQKIHSIPENEKVTTLSYFAAYCKQVCVILIDEITTHNNYVEILRLTLDDCIFSQRPKVEVYSKNKRVKTRIKKEVLICATQLQLDNQMSNEGNYDYPVVIIPQKRSQDLLNINDNVSFEILLQAVKNNAFVCVEIVTEIINNRPVPGYEKLALSIKPIAFYIEDTFLYRILDIFDTYKPRSITNSRWQNLSPRIGKIPVRCFIMSNVYQSPYIVENLSIESTELLLSVHASLKLCISLVETPLSFKKFERLKLLTTDDRIGNAIVMHYLSGALIRAGWVVGSIDLLGNPGGFARSVGSGVADFVRMPYQGFFRGPWAFISGVAYGSSSLLRQISGGSIFSLTNLASSVSRNMERLSLDETYRLQNEESRRHKPDNLTEGLSQGLTGLGISLLGAIAGIVDQPIQSIQKAVEEESFPPTAAVTGLISGVSKGLVGIVAKPVGGAAEFVAQAGQGILHGTGWSQILKPRFEGITELVEHNRNSRLKYYCKMLTSLPGVELITAIEATQFNQAGHYVPCVLLLTTQVLFLVNIVEDTQQQAFSLSELDCHGLSSDPTLIYLIPIQKLSNKISQSEERTQDRVVDFVSKSTKYAGVLHVTTDESESQSDSSTRLTPPPEQLATSLKFFVNPPLRNIFVSLFNSVKRHFLGKGFS